MHNARFLPYVILLCAGIFWGATIPAAKYVMSTGYSETGVVFWEAVFVGLFAGLLVVIQKVPLGLTPQRIKLSIWVAIFGTLVPGTLGYLVIQHIPAGVFAIIIALVPMFVMPIALLLGNEKLSWLRVGGIVLGLGAIALIVLPDTSLPDRSAIWFVLIALAIPLSYALEDNYIALTGRFEMAPAAILLVAMCFVAPVIGGIALIRGELFLLGADGWGGVEWALVGVSLMHGLAYAIFIWLIGKTGPVFTSLVAYLVTGFGVIWSVILLGERYTIWVWCALALIFVAMFLVQPRSEAENAPKD